MPTLLAAFAALRVERPPLLTPPLAAFPAPEPAPVEPQVTPGPVASYADQLAAYEARRRVSDDILLRKMANPRDATPFGRPF
jgi:hypothetical protein